MTMLARTATFAWRTQRGAIAVIVALSAVALVGFAGIVIDVGRLYVNKSELQTAADACALAASSELTCDPTGGTCPAAFLLNAQAAGIFAASRNRRDFQVNSVAITEAQVTFSTVFAPNSNYLSIAGGALPNSRYVMCTAQATGIAPWFMSIFSATAQTVTASAVGTLAPSLGFCNAAPVGLCAKAGGYVMGEWIKADFTSAGNNDDLTGSFRWVDYTPNAGGNTEIRDMLAGTSSVCNIQIGNNVDIAQPGAQQGAKSAYNTRFGLYPNGANAYTPTLAPPDHTGYAYPNQSPGSPVIAVPTANPPVGNAYADYRVRQGNNTPFISAQYGVSGAGGNIPGDPISAADQLSYGSERRLVAAPILDCTGGASAAIGSVACVLMLNPMSNGATGSIYLEYRGLATAVGSPCRTGGSAAGPGANGPQVPTLVQ